MTVIGVHFKRGGATPFLDVPASELRDTTAPIEDVCGQAAVSLRERLLEQENPDERLAILERWLAARLMARRRVAEPAVLWAARQIERRPHVQIREVADHIGRSSRWFISRFADDVGLTPKVFGRVQRFQRALRRLHRSTGPDLAGVAASTGYFDQAHLTHEFRSIAGLTPSQYLASRTGFLNHVAIGD
jgi:AraC-like DNA-binding protein